MKKQAIALTRADLQRIWQHHGFGTVDTIEEPAGGVMNQLFIVNDTAVIRLNRNARRYENEALLYRLLADRPVPVPQVLAVDTSREVVDYDYLITSKIEGASVHATWWALDDDQQQRLAQQAGAALAHIHTITYENFGKLHRLDVDDWYEYMMMYLRLYCRRMRKHEAVIGNVLFRMQAAFEAREALLRAVSQPVLLHSDFHTENLMQQGGTLTGIVDWEWAFAGDAAWDFAVDYHWRKYRPPFGDYVQAAYHAQHPLDEAAHERIALYRLLPQLEDALWAKIQGHDEAWAQSFEAFLANLRAVEGAS